MVAESDSALLRDGFERRRVGDRRRVQLNYSANRWPKSPFRALKGSRNSLRAGPSAIISARSLIIISTHSFYFVKYWSERSTPGRRFVSLDLFRPSF